MITTLIVLASVTFVAMMSPGPDMMLLVKYSTARERLYAFACILGIFTGVLFHVSLSILGIAAMIAASATLFTLVKIAGAIYLIYIGIQSLRSTGGVRFQTAEVSSSPATQTWRLPYRDGLLCNLLNPKVTLFMLAVFTQVIDPSTPASEKVIYGLFIAFQSIVVWSLFVLLVRTRWVLSFLQQFQQAINRTVGVVLIAFGAALFWEESSD